MASQLPNKAGETPELPSTEQQATHMPVIQTEALREKLLKLDELQDGLGTKIVENLEFPICPFHIVQSLSTKLFARIAVAYCVRADMLADILMPMKDVDAKREEG